MEKRWYATKEEHGIKIGQRVFPHTEALTLMEEPEATYWKNYDIESFLGENRGYEHNNWRHWVTIQNCNIGNPIDYVSKEKDITAKVIDCDYQYSSYKNWVELNFPEYSNMFKTYDQSLKNDEIVIVVGSALWGEQQSKRGDFSDSDVLYLVRHKGETAVHIIGGEGLEFISKPDFKVGDKVFSSPAFGYYITKTNYTTKKCDVITEFAPRFQYEEIDTNYFHSTLKTTPKVFSLKKYIETLDWPKKCEGKTALEMRALGFLTNDAWMVEK